MENNPYLSVIIPAYKEEKKIGPNLLETEKFLSAKGFSYEILVVVDGSPDKTAEGGSMKKSQQRN